MVLLQNMIKPNIDRTIIGREKISKSEIQDNELIFIKGVFLIKNLFKQEKRKEALKNIQNEVKSYQLKLNDFRKDFNGAIEYSLSPV
jgi:hypothetical protein